MSTQALFIVSNLVGGGEVLESYYWGLASFPEYREALSVGCMAAYEQSSLYP